MQYGHFDDKNKEYVITQPDTPKSWSNYLGSTEYGAIITNNAGGIAFTNQAAWGVSCVSGSIPFHWISQDVIFTCAIEKAKTIGLPRGNQLANRSINTNRNVVTEVLIRSSIPNTKRLKPKLPSLSQWARYLKCGN